MSNIIKQMQKPDFINITKGRYDYKIINLPSQKQEIRFKFYLIINLIK